MLRVVKIILFFMLLIQNASAAEFADTTFSEGTKSTLSHYSYGPNGGMHPTVKRDSKSWDLPDIGRPVFGLQFLLYGVIAVLVSVAVFYIVSAVYGGIRTKEKSQQQEGEDELIPHNNSDLKRLLEKYLNNHEYEKALVTLYEYDLFLLDRKKLIVLDESKTTNDYYREIRDANKRRAFRGLTSILLLVRYAEHEACDDDVQKALGYHEQLIVNERTVRS